jgi:hypothetical protein
MADAIRVQDMIANAIGVRHKRPLFDTPDNYGAVTGGSGSYDHKAVEPVTNMQDSVLELEALRRFGSIDAVPFKSPLEASRELFTKKPYQDLAQKVRVEIRESDAPAVRTKRITIVYRDRGRGLTAADVPRTIFGLRSTKKELSWQQGAFGIGGKTTYRNARAVVLVSRPAPETLGPGEEDRIAVAVLQWEFKGKTQTASYLVTKPWEKPGDEAPVFSVPAAEFPAFEPGVHLALISYGVEHIHVGNFADERSFYTLLNTRLFEPVLPIGLDHFNRPYQSLRGLQKRLEDNPGDPPRKTAEETLPFNADGRTYHLPIRYYVFSAKGDPGERRRFAAPGHVVIFTSNGQTHHQWSQTEFRDKIPALQRLADRIFVVVETDELPIEVRSTLFTADRSAMMRTEQALRLEAEVAAFLRDWEDLRELHGELVRKALSDGQTERSTVNLAKELGRAFKGLGFGGASGSGSGGGRQNGSGKPGGNGGSGTGSGHGSRSGGGSGKIELYPDPTTLDGPESVRALAGESKGIYFHINAYDNFIPNRARLEITSNSEEIGEREITIGPLSSGRLRVSIAIPEDIESEAVSIHVVLPPWVKASGGLGPQMEWTTQIEIVSTWPQTGKGNNKGRGEGKSNGARLKGDGSGGDGGAGDIVPIIWKNTSLEAEWNAQTVGEVEVIPASDLAKARPEYAADLAPLAATSITVLSLNSDFTQYKKYIGATIRESTDRTRAIRQNRYAMSVGMGLLSLDQRTKGLKKRGIAVPDEVVAVTQQAVAIAVLADLRAYDKLAEETGVEQGGYSTDADVATT